ncbi:MAG: hypothetical protein AAF491_02375 [Verrucomicrobiota bacterium]
MTALPFLSRVFHQARTDWRHHWLLVAIWFVLLFLSENRHLPGVNAVFSILYSYNHAGWLEILPLLVAAAVVLRCVHSDSPSNSDTASLTRPLGQGAVWTGKALFLLSAVILPLLVVMSFRWQGIDLGFSQQFAIGGSVVLAIALLCSLVGSVTALTSSPRQVLGLAIFAAVGLGVWLAIPKPWLTEDQFTVESIRTDLCGTLIASLTALAGLSASWWIATVPRRRFLAGGLFLTTLLLAGWISQSWNREWITQPEQPYARSANLTLKPGPFVKGDPKPGRKLWPTLRIAGLGKDEVASVLEFAPILDGKPWPPEGSHSDIPTLERGYDSWLHHEHTRVLFKYFPPTTLWSSHIYNGVVYNGRGNSDQLLQQLRMSRDEAIEHRWRLRLVIHEMKLIGRMPYRQLWTQQNVFPIRPGMRLELDTFGWMHDAWEMQGQIHRTSSAILPVTPFRKTLGRGREMNDDFFLVLEDRDLRDNTVYSLGLTRRRPNRSHLASGAAFWIHQESQHFTIRLWHPQDQQVFLERTLDEWIDEQDASLWHGDDRGFVEFELSPEQVAEIFPEPEQKEN